jgi:uncharacterized delta-60 repeat protein
MLAALAALLVVPAPAGASVGKFGMAVQPDGKIVVAGGAGIAIGKGRGKEAGAVARYTPDGGLDRGFGRNGVAIVRTHTDFTDPMQPFTAVALQPDGRILATSPIGELSRLLPDGSLDRGFGVGGVAPASTISAYYPTGVAVEADGSILVGGTTGYPNDPGEHLYGRLYRYTPNGKRSRWVGSMSPSTGAEDPKSSMSGFLTEAGGRAIAAGSVGPRAPLPARDHLALARLFTTPPRVVDAQDRPDPSFAAGAGLVSSSFFPESPLPESANALAWDRGKVLVAGQALGAMLLARYGRNGTLDRGFGRGGATVTGVHGPAPDGANAVAVQPSGRIVVAGATGHRCPAGECAGLALARYRANGRLDRGFGADGVVSPRVVAGGQASPVTEIAYGVANQPGERILVGGLLVGGGGTRFFLRRYLPSGKPDGTFGDAGRVTTLPLRVARGRG